MDILTILGLSLAVVAILGGQMLEGGHVGSLIQPAAALIVFGGTIGATMIQYRLPVFMRSIGFATKVVIRSTQTPKNMIDQIIDFATVSRKQGLLALEVKMKESKDPVLKKGLQLIVDGTEAEVLRDILEIDIGIAEETANDAAKVWETLGGYAPTIGIIGAVMGLIHVMENLADPSKLGAGIAVAFVATIYGIGAANLLFLPVFGKLKSIIRQEAVLGEIIVEGLSGLVNGENPRLIQDKLDGYLEPKDRAMQT